MKTETQIAKNKIEILWMLKKSKQTSPVNAYEIQATLCNEHKATCQGFLEFLEEEMKRWETIQELQKKVYISTGELEEKIIDLKQVIKEYNKNGIKK